GGVQGEQAGHVDAADPRRRTLGKESAEGAMDRGRDRAMAPLEVSRYAAGRALQADPSRQAGQLVRIVGQRVGLELVEDLQAMLDRAQVHVGRAERAAEGGREVATLRAPEERLQGVALAQPAVVAPVEELKRLDEELDLADPSSTELHVGAGPFLQVAVDLALHVPHGADDPRVDTRAVDDRARQLHEAR